MLGKNNKYERERKMGERITRWSIRRLNVGVASVVVASGFLLGGGYAVQADTLSEGEEPVLAAPIEDETENEEVAEPSPVETTVVENEANAIENETPQSEEPQEALPIVSEDQTETEDIQAPEDSSTTEKEETAEDQTEIPEDFSDELTNLQALPQEEKTIPLETEVLSTEDMDVYVSKYFPSVEKYVMKKGDLKGKTFYGQTSPINTIRINEAYDIDLSKEDVKTTFEGNKAIYEMTLKKSYPGFGPLVDAVITAELTAEGNTLDFKITNVKNNLDENKAFIAGTQKEITDPKELSGRIQEKFSSLLTSKDPNDQLLLAGIFDALKLDTEEALKAFVENLDRADLQELKALAGLLGVSTTSESGEADEIPSHYYAIQTIEIPNHSLISINTNQKGANFRGALMSSNTTISGDEAYDMKDITAANFGSKDYMYGFISNDEMSAGLWSNSENDGRARYTAVAGGSNNTRVLATAENKGDYTSLGLGSTKWYWHREELDSKNVPHLVKETAMPEAKVVIAGDVNGDGTINWQDGAIAFRDIMNNPFKSEEVPDLVAYRIAMNFGSQAQNPFLKTLDNAKKVALNLDGLGQSIILKGYANEGHDSGHPDYGDVGKRIGGVKDMNTLLTEGAKFGARFGVHVNAGEMYPEAKAFDENLVRRDEKGNLKYGWNWLDQAVGIDSVYDLASGLRKERFDQLKKEVGDNLDFIYVDIWGNQTGGSDDSWQTRKLSKEINDNGWRMTTEWGATNEYDSTFQHWAGDLTYGGYTSKGENSEIIRFLRNHQKDSWVADYPSYGGAAMAPLLGGYSMKDFEGWQGRNDYDAYIKNVYTYDLLTKFIQHYKITSWQDADTSFTKPVPGATKGETYTWTPDMKITLKNGEDTLVLQRGSANPDDPAYRDRTVTLNGVVISKGSLPRGDNGQGGDEAYLLPWFWDAKTGKKVDSADEKLYHWNNKGGESEWQLPSDWADLKEVVVYKLTDLGRTDEHTVLVKDGKITLTADAKTPYVIYKTEQAAPKVEWSTGMPVQDAGFNSGTLSEWSSEGDGQAEIVKSKSSNPMLKLSGEKALTQELRGLTPGKHYAALVGVDNRSDAKASMTLKSGDKILGTNYTNRSIAQNYVKADAHNTNNPTIAKVGKDSYFQNMYVFFTAPENGKVTLTLAKEGEGDVYFDDIRIVENNSHNIVTNDKGEIVKFTQDFETNVQGIYPFVIGNIEGVEDNRTHLSELHAPYTQADWDVKKMDDVLDGNWSLKTNGLVQRSRLAYQTIPQNFRFEPGRTYKVGFDYQAGSDGTYAVAIGVGNDLIKTFPLDKFRGNGNDGYYTFDITGDPTGQTWFGIYSTNKAPDVEKASTTAEQNFGGYMDFVLDNLVIERQEENVTRESLENLLTEAKQKYNKDDYEEDIWNHYQKELAKAKVTLGKDRSTDEEIEHSYFILKAEFIDMGRLGGVDPSSDERDLPLEGLKPTAGSQQSGKENAVTNALDNDPSTIWHTTWAGTPMENQWIDIQLPTPGTVGGLRLLPRSNGQNGIITKADILVKTTDDEDYRLVKTVDLGTSGWQLITFADIDDVTNVRIQSKSTIGDTANKFSSIAEVRILGPKVEKDYVVDKTPLEKVLNQAKALKEKDYTPDSWKTLEKKQQVGQAVYDQEDATDYDVLLAAANLQIAIDDLKKLEPQEENGQVDKADLQKVVKRYDQLKESDYTPDSWKDFASKLNQAKLVLQNRKATQQQVDAARRQVDDARWKLVLVEKPSEQDPTPAKPTPSKPEQQEVENEGTKEGLDGFFGEHRPSVQAAPLKDEKAEESLGESQENAKEETTKPVEVTESASSHESSVVSNEAKEETSSSIKAPAKKAATLPQTGIETDTSALIGGLMLMTMGIVSIGVFKKREMN